MVEKKTIRKILEELYNDSLSDTAYGTNKEGKNINQALSAISTLINEATGRMKRKMNKNEVRKAVEEMKAVLCDPEGNVCISGSEKDREIVQHSLRIIEKYLFNVQ